MDKGRLMAITDGIIAIAATIMVLELELPDNFSFRSISEQFPTLLAYCISFLQIWIVWRSHHDTFLKAKVINSKIYFLNGLWVFFITLVPFATGIVGRNINHPGTHLMYVTVLFLGSLTFQILNRQVNIVNVDMPENVVGNKKAKLVLFGGYVLAALSTLLFLILCLCIIGIICVTWIIRMCVTEKE